MQGLTASEAQIYDRQIRTWGVDAQKALTEACVLFVGTFDGICVEVMKNLVLSGVGKVILHNDRGSERVTEDDVENNFLLDDDDLKKSKVERMAARLQKLNPLVKVEGYLLIKLDVTVN